MSERLYLNHTARYWHKKYREEKDRGDRLEAMIDRMADKVVDRDAEIDRMRRELTAWRDREQQRRDAARQQADHRTRAEANRTINKISAILREKP